MRRQAAIYFAYATLGVAMCAYIVTLCVTAWDLYGVSSTFAACVGLAAALGAVTAFHAWMAFLFKARAVAGITRTARGIVLMPANAALPTLTVQDVRVVRTFGEQFSRDESVSACRLFKAADRYWVTMGPVDVDASGEAV